MPDVVTNDNWQDYVTNKLAQKRIDENASKIRDLSKYEKLTSDNPNLKVDYQPLNFQALKDIGAFRVTHQGLDDGYNPDPKAGFSLVSAYNDAVGDQTRNWKENPSALPVVQKMFEKMPENIGAHKYMQIVQSARDLGLPDEHIFLSKD
jgi:hypothetical protein